MGEVCLNDGEKIILKAQGTIQFSSTWKQGHLLLTDRRLIFIQVAKTVLEISLDKIIGISIVRKSWLLGIKIKQLHIELNCRGERGHVYVALAKPDEWIERIKESMTLMLAERWCCNGAKPEPPGNAQ